MAIRSENDPWYSARFLAMGGVMVFFSLWCLYDGFIAYPHAQERGLLYDKLNSEKRDNDWAKEAESRGWSAEVPLAPLTDEEFVTKVRMQYAMAALTMVIGLPMLVVALKSLGNWVESTDTGIASSWGQSLDFDQITWLDKKRWRKKGIATITYQDGDTSRKFVLDDFKFKRYAMDQILYEVEQRIDPEKIVNGPPEQPPHGEYAEQPSDEFSHEFDQPV